MTNKLTNRGRLLKHNHLMASKGAWWKAALWGWVVVWTTKGAKERERHERLGVIDRLIDGVG